MSRPPAVWDRGEERRISGRGLISAYRYVAMHTMQDHLTEYGHTNGIKDVGAAVFGMMIPLVTQIGHHH